MGDKVNITSSGKRVSGEKSDEQKKRLDEIEGKKAANRKVAAEAEAAEREAAKAAEEKKRAEQKAAEEAKAKAESDAKARREAVEKIGTAALSAGGAAVSSVVDDARKGKLKVSSKTVVFVVIGLAIVALLLFIAWPRLSAMLFPEPEPTTAVELSESAIMGNTTAEIGDAILGEARQKQELVVWEQDVQVDSEISQALANLAVFSKTKTVRSFGTGVYTVDMGQIDESSIAVDEQARTVTMSIPHAQLQYITKDLEKTEFEDTQHAIFGFGDVKLTQEQQNLLEQSIEESMRAELESAECFADADEAALLEVYNVYAPLITKEREYARDILSHVNPHTGLALKDDPVVAMVEINNENTQLFSMDSVDETINEGYEAIMAHKDELLRIFK